MTETHVTENGAAGEVRFQFRALGAAGGPVGRVSEVHSRPGAPLGEPTPGKRGSGCWVGALRTFQNPVRLQKLMENFELLICPYVAFADVAQKYID